MTVLKGAACTSQNEPLCEQCTARMQDSAPIFVGRCRRLDFEVCSTAADVTPARNVLVQGHLGALARHVPGCSEHVGRCASHADISMGRLALANKRQLPFVGQCRYRKSSLILEEQAPLYLEEVKGRGRDENRISIGKRLNNASRIASRNTDCIYPPRPAYAFPDCVRSRPPMWR